MIKYQNETRITARIARGNLLSNSDSSLSKIESQGEKTSKSTSIHPSGGNHLSPIRKDLVTLNQQSRIDHRGLEDIKQVIKRQANLLRLRQALKLRVCPKNKTDPRGPITFLTP
jgi:hypothetical protein